jgi:RHS repeat-associated protein
MIRAAPLVGLCLLLIPSAGTLAAQGDPRVRLEEPDRGERRFVAPAEIPIEARADAARGRTIVKVEFFAEDQSIGQATEAPYQIVWTQVPVGRYRLRARATDDRGAIGLSAPVLVRVHENRVPWVRLISPRPGQSYAAPATIELRAQARDRDHNLARVEFYANGVLLGTDTAPRFAFSWTGVAAGTYNVVARAVDSLGATDDSSVVTIAVVGNQAPSVKLTAPANGGIFAAPATITLAAQVEDTDGTVTQVEFFEGATLVATMTTPPYSSTMNNLQAGNYSFTARATDNLGASTTSSMVSVIVNAAVPQIYYIHLDHLNTPRLIADGTGVTVWIWYQAEPFGTNPGDENRGGLGAFEFPSRFPGQYYDLETGVHHNYFRDYEPHIGRYIESDPIGLRGGLNTYAYVGTDPLSWIDPTGLAVLICQRPLGGLWGGFNRGTSSSYDSYIPSPINPLYHQYLCIGDDGSFKCGGQGTTGGIIAPGTPSEDYFPYNRTDLCEPVQASSCVEQCALRKLASSQRPFYILLYSDCQRWSKQVLKECEKECKGK